MDEERIPVHSERYEKQLVAGAIISGDRVWPEVSYIDAADFHIEAHALIWRAIAAMKLEGLPLGPEEVAHALEASGDLERVGGHPRLAAISAHGGYDREAVIAARIVRDNADRRRLVSAARKLEFDASVKDGGKASSVVLMEVEKELRDISARLHCADIRSMSDALGDGMARLRGELPPEPMTPTGFAALDAILAGGMVNRLYVVVGRPGHGKTALMLGIGSNVAAAGRSVVEFHMELDEQEVFRRRLSAESDVFEAKLRDPASISAVHGDWDQINRAAGVIGEWSQRIRLHCQPGMTASQIAAMATKAANDAEGELGLVTVDHLHIMEHPREKGQRKDDAMGESTGVLRDLALSLKCPVLMGCQLNRGLESRGTWEKRPGMADIREVGALEQDAYAVLGCFMPFRYGLSFTEEHVGEQCREKVPDTYAEIVVSKNRGGRTGFVPMSWRGPTLKWGERWPTT